MNDHVVKRSFDSREEAEAVAQQLIERGIPQTSIAVDASSVTSNEMPPVGPSIGSGVTPEATEALIDAHDGESTAVEQGFTLEVDTHGDPLQEAVVSEVFGYLA
jgi:hypothetical protein